MSTIIIDPIRTFFKSFYEIAFITTVSFFGIRSKLQ